MSDEKTWRFDKLYGHVTLNSRGEIIGECNLPPSECPHRLDYAPGLGQPAAVITVNIVVHHETKP